MDSDITEQSPVDGIVANGLREPSVMDTIREEDDSKSEYGAGEEVVLPEQRPRTTSAKLPSLKTRAKFVRTPDSQVDTTNTEQILITEIKPKDDEDYEELGEEQNEETAEETDDTVSDITDSEHEKVAVIEDDYDTDLENEELEAEQHDLTGRHSYVKLCEQLGVVPCSYFVRHITEPQIVMKHHGLGPAGTMAIAKVLKDNITLEKIDLQGNWMEADGGRYIAKMMEDNYYITELVLADNKLGTEGAYHISRMLTVNTTLRKIDLSENGLEDRDSEYFAEVLDDNKVLSYLRLSGNAFGIRSGHVLGQAIAGNDTLEHLDLSWNEIRRSGAIAIAQGLKENVRIKSCDLSWNGFGEEGGLAIAEALTVNSTLIELDLTGNRLNIVCAEKIAKALGINDCLQTLKIGNNPISTAGAISIVSAINASESSAITVLDLTDIPVEFEFIRIVEEIQMKRQFQVVHGNLMRSGNTTADIGKPGVDPNVKDPLIVLKEHIVVNDLRIVDALKKFDPGDTLCVSPDNFMQALSELEIRYKRSQINDITHKLDKFNNGTIYYGDFIPPEGPERGEEDLGAVINKKKASITE
ncbi:uncharacterized protein LOC141910602 [Tubulanus polymorphus]|uniref:uncharacterized protein LOC141910602 n=1 Tax=Tubulanus polymorphus TaxID=672921 RepID=UPI003DA586A3